MRFLTAISFVIFALAFFLLPSGVEERLSRLGRLFVSPAEEFGAVSQRVAREALGGLPEGMTVEERDELLSELARVKNELSVRDASEESLRAENRQLQRLLRHVRQPRDYSLVVAEVVGRGVLFGRSESLVIDRGATDGILAGQAVMTIDGVVGVVVDSTPRQATVRLYTSRSFSLAAEVPAKRTSGILENRKGRVMLTMPMGDAFDSLLPGETLCTSDLGSDMMQPGLNIGVIESKERQADDVPAYVVRPAASTGDIRYVMVAIRGKR